MNNHSVMTVDLGSSYTKIAVRTSWDAPSTLVEDLPGSLDELRFCIPSTVAHVTSAGRDEWVIGLDADALRAGDGVQVFTNWKSTLFAGVDNTPDAIARCNEARAVAVHFFTRLRRAVQARVSARGGEDIPVRVCVPKLEPHPSVVMDEVLAEAGWCVAKGRTTVFEPESNALGVLSRGLNSTWIPPYQDFRPHRGREMMLPKMLDRMLSGAMRRGALSDTRRQFGVLVVDVGAFTTDFGYVEFDTSFWTDDWRLPPITQQSVALGVRELDHAVRRAIRLEAHQALASQTNADWERTKQRLYSGATVSLMAGPLRSVKIGEGEERLDIDGVIRHFTGRILEEHELFVGSLGTSQVHAIILTGGGTMIPGVRQMLISELSRDGRTVTHDLLDQDEPMRALGNAAEPRAVESRRKQNRQLIRGGSAIGGCSVFFE